MKIRLRKKLDKAGIKEYYEEAMKMDYRLDDPYTRQLAIRAKCIDCSAWQDSEVRKCTAYTCRLWPWRMGTLDQTDYANEK